MADDEARANGESHLGCSRGQRQHVSGAVVAALVRHVKEQTGERGVAQMLATASERCPAPAVEGAVKGAVENEDGWCSYREVVALFDAASQVLGEPAIGRTVGQAILGQPGSGTLIHHLRSLEPLPELLRHAPRAWAEVTTTVSLDALDVGEGHATLRAAALGGLTPSKHMCGLAKGVLASVPSLFGLGAAAVTESECQMRGAGHCIYHLTWGSQQPLPRDGEHDEVTQQPAGRPGSSGSSGGADARIASLRDEIRRERERLDGALSTASELLFARDLGPLLGDIARRAADAVQAPRSLLVVRSSAQASARVHPYRIDEQAARRIAQEIWQPVPGDADGARLIVDVASARRTYGRLVALRTSGERFTPDEARVVSLYANYAAAALDRVSAADEAQRSSTAARAVLAFSRSLSRAGTTAQIAQALADTVTTVSRCTRASVYTWEAEHGCLELQAASWCAPARGANAHPRAAEAAATLDAIDTPIVATLMGARDLVVVDRATDDPHLCRRLHALGLSSEVMMPLSSDGRFLGAVTLGFASTPPQGVLVDENLEELIRALADHAATALENERLLAQVGHLAWHDALTGLPNRRLLEDRVRQELERSARNGEHSTVLFIDLDRFKVVNDTLGHAAGDELIRLVAQRLEHLVRRQDTVARLGGDEFAVLLPGLSDRGAIDMLARRILTTLGEPYTVALESIVNTASIGIAVHPDHGRSFEELLSHADEAMYRSKGAGCNTYTVFADRRTAPEPATTS